MSRAIKCDGCSHVFELQGEKTSETFLEKIVRNHNCAEYKPGTTVVNK